MEAARFPSVPIERGLYESFYVRAGHPREPLAVWIRYTVHKRPGAAPRGSVWFTLFDAASGSPRASKVTLDDVAADDGGYIRIGASRLDAGAAHGTARSDRVDAAWSLELEPLDDRFEHLPRPWMYRAAIPRTKLVTLVPSARVSGRVTVDGRTIDLDGWPGMVGHNWGAEHAERWVWLHAVAFEEDQHAWLDAAIGRIRLGPLTLPWVANGCLSIDGQRHRLGGVERFASTRVDARPGRCAFELPGSGARVRGAVSADLANSVAWLYADPGGGEHETLNCSAAQLELTLERRGEPPLTLHTASGASYELGVRERVDGIELQPFPDG